jgi:hypothetical protein
MVNAVTQKLAQKPVARATQLSAFAEALGSREGVDPIPPSQYLFFLDKGQPALQRFLAWVRSKTLRYREQRNGGDGRRAWCVDSRGKELHLADAARELGWPRPFATKVCKEAEKLRLVRREGRRIFLVGDVPAPDTENVICTDNILRFLPPRLNKIIESWPAEKRAEFAAVWIPATELSESLQARHMAEARNTVTRMYDTIFDHFGLPKKHLKQPAPPPPIEVPEQLNLFVKLAPFGSVHITSGPPRTDNGTAPRTDNRILMEQRIERDLTPSSSSLVAAQQLAAALRIDDDAAMMIWSRCTLANPAVSVDAIVVLAEWKARERKGRVGSWTGLLLTALPKMVTGALYQEAAAEAVKRNLAEVTARALSDSLDAEFAAELADTDGLPKVPTVWPC